MKTFTLLLCLILLTIIIGCDDKNNNTTTPLYYKYIIYWYDKEQNTYLWFYTYNYSVHPVSKVVTAKVEQILSPTWEIKTKQGEKINIPPPVVISRTDKVEVIKIQ